MCYLITTIFLNQCYFTFQEASDENIRASEVLLELLVKIAAHPSQWEQVHDLLRKSYKG